MNEVFLASSKILLEIVAAVTSAKVVVAFVGLAGFTENTCCNQVA